MKNKRQSENFLPHRSDGCAKETPLFLNGMDSNRLNYMGNVIEQIERVRSSSRSDNEKRYILFFGQLKDCSRGGKETCVSQR